MDGRLQPHVQSARLPARRQTRVLPERNKAMTQKEEKALLDTLKLSVSAVRALSRRVRWLEKEHIKLVVHLGELAVVESGVMAKDLANFEALMTIVQELTQHEGISRQAFQRHYDSVYQHCLERYLHKLEETEPRHAAEIDKRTIAEIESTESLSPLFPEPPEET
jgi:hypothetical protein